MDLRVPATLETSKHSTPLLKGNKDAGDHSSAVPSGHQGLYHSLVDSSKQEYFREVRHHVISCHKMSYKVPVKARCDLTARRKPNSTKVILENISGVFRPGLNAVMGSAACGKTTLLDVLAGRKDPAGLQGLVLVDGQPQPKNFKCISGYVLQEDIIMETLTVRENLTFSANLRMPRHIQNQEERVTEVLKELELTEVADSKIGTEFTRGVSGGEKKRCAIGMELITSPGVLFLDEPTTGLDASAANAVMALLWRLGRAGQTIIISTGQQPYSIFRLFDNLVLLGAGKLVYQGPAAEALEYFSSIGYQCEEHNSPADFLLDVVNGDSTALQSIGTVNHAFSPTDNEEIVSDLAELYSQSKWSTQWEKEAAAILEKSNTQNGSSPECADDHNTGFCTQFRYVSKRALLNSFRNPQSSVIPIITMLIFSSLVGALFYNIGASQRKGLQNRLGSFFFITMNMVFSNLGLVGLFFKDKPLFLNEIRSGYYRVSTYLLAKILFDIVPMRILPISIYAAVSYFLVGYQMSADRFFIYLATLLLVALSSTSLTYLLSVSIRNYTVALLCTATPFILMLLFGGMLVNLSTIQAWLQWLKYLSLFRYSLNALSINELHGLELCQHTLNGTLIGCGKGFADDYLTTFLGIEEAGEAWTLWQNHVALSVMMVVFFTLSYVQLRRVKKLT